MSAEPCALHDLSNCATCTGVDRRHERSLADAVPAGRPAPIAGGVTIWAEYGGTCGNCGGRFEIGDAIWRAYGDWNGEGWIGVECCVG